jgi:hypothetical protein
MYEQNLLTNEEKKSLGVKLILENEKIQQIMLSKENLIVKSK